MDETTKETPHAAAPEKPALPPEPLRNRIAVVIVLALAGAPTALMLYLAPFFLPLLIPPIAMFVLTVTLIVRLRRKRAKRLMALQAMGDSEAAPAPKLGPWPIEVLYGLACVTVLFHWSCGFFGPFSLMFLTIPTAFLGAVIAALLVKFVWRKSWRTAIRRAFRTAIVCAAVLVWTAFFIPGAGVANGSQWARLKLMADVDAIRTWAGSSPDISLPPGEDIMEDAPDGSIEVHWDRWPACVRWLHPGRVFLSPETGRVLLVWDRMGRRWGMDVVQASDVEGPQPGLTLEKGATVWWRVTRQH
ncbi:MAG: hypothetical protein ACYS8X_00990 [Planctomycetota bacterium]|jgi:hypothetical protein